MVFQRAGSMYSYKIKKYCWWVKHQHALPDRRAVLILHSAIYYRISRCRMTGSVRYIYVFRVEWQEVTVIGDSSDYCCDDVR